MIRSGGAAGAAGDGGATAAAAGATAVPVGGRLLQFVRNHRWTDHVIVQVTQVIVRFANLQVGVRSFAAATEVKPVDARA